MLFCLVFCLFEVRQVQTVLVAVVGVQALGLAVVEVAVPVAVDQVGAVAHQVVQAVVGCTRNCFTLIDT